MCLGHRRRLYTWEPYPHPLPHLLVLVDRPALDGLLCHCELSAARTSDSSWDGHIGEELTPSRCIEAFDIPESVFIPELRLHLRFGTVHPITSQRPVTLLAHVVQVQLVDQWKCVKHLQPVSDGIS